MAIRLPIKAVKAAKLSQSVMAKRPFTAGELKALWLQYPIVVKREYSCRMKRTPNTYKRLNEYMTKYSEKLGPLEDWFFEELAEELKTSNIYDLIESIS
jgi:hypothetical protein